MALGAYIQRRGTSNLLVNSDPSDKYIDIALVHNFSVMADIFIHVMQYFGIQRPDIVETLVTTWESLGHERLEGVDAPGVA